MQELNRFQEVVLLEQLHWLFEAKWTGFQAKSVQDLTETIKAKLVVHGKEGETVGGENESAAELEKQVGRKEEKLKTAVAEQEKLETDMDEKDGIELAFEKVQGQHIEYEEKAEETEEEKEDDLAEEKGEDKLLEQESREITEGRELVVSSKRSDRAAAESYGRSRRRRSEEGIVVLSTVNRSDYIYIPTVDKGRDVETVAEERPEEAIADLDIVISADHSREKKQSSRLRDRTKISRASEPTARRRPQSRSASEGTRWRLTGHGVWQKY